MEKKAVPVLHDWFVTQGGGMTEHNTDRTPLLDGRVVGNVYGHATRPPGHPITTSRIVDAKGRLVYTKSGSVYRLGRIKRDYLKWLKANNMRWDPKNPIRMHASLLPVIGEA